MRGSSTEPAGHVTGREMWSIDPVEFETPEQARALVGRPVLLDVEGDRLFNAVGERADGHLLHVRVVGPVWALVEMTPYEVSIDLQPGLHPGTGIVSVMPRGVPDGVVGVSEQPEGYDELPGMWERADFEGGAPDEHRP